MTSLDDEIAALKVDIANLTVQRNSIMPSDETKVERRDLLLSTINAKQLILNLLMQRQSQSGKKHVECAFKSAIFNLGSVCAAKIGTRLQTRKDSASEELISQLRQINVSMFAVVAFVLIQSVYCVYFGSWWASDGLVVRGLQWAQDSINSFVVFCIVGWLLSWISEKCANVRRPLESQAKAN